MLKFNAEILEHVAAVEPDIQTIFFNYSLYKNNETIYDNTILLGMLKFILSMEDRTRYEKELTMLLEICHGGGASVI